MSPAGLDRSRAPGAGPLRPFRFPRIYRFELSNGLPVLFARTEGPPVATMSLLLPAGAAREAPAEAGLATLTGSLLETGTTELNAAQIAERIEGLGVRVHVGASWEVASVDFTALAARLEDAAHLAAHLVHEAIFPQGEVERLRSEQLAGIMQRRADPRALANEMIGRFVYAEGVPFARPLAGTPETVAGLSRESAIQFHRSYYTPHTAALIIAGSLSLESARGSADRVFGHWSGPTVDQLEIPVEPRERGRQVVIVDRPGAVQSEIRIAHVGVARNHPDYFPILVMNTILGGSFSSRLNMNLREKHGFTYGASSSFLMRRRPGPFLAATAVQTEVTGAAVREILTELDRIREAEPSTTELAGARQYLAGTFPLRLETTDGVASRLAELFVHDLPDSYLDEHPSRILAVEGSDVLRVAREQIRPEEAVVLVVGDPERVTPQLEAIGLGSVSTLSLTASA